MTEINKIISQSSSQYINWEPEGNLTSEQKEKIKSGDIGKVLNFSTLQDGSLRIKTEYGTLSLSGPELDDVKKNLTVSDFSSTYSRFESFSTTNYMTDLYAVLKLLHETNVERRQADREVRHASRDIAMSESLNAAQQIRNGALCSLILGCVSGTINIGTGVISAAGALKSLGQMKTSMQDLNNALANLKSSDIDVKLKQQQLELSQVKGEIKLNQDIVTSKQQALFKADTDVAIAQKNLDNKLAQIETKQKEIDKLVDPLAGKLINEADKPKLEQLQSEMKTLKSEQEELQVKLDTAKQTQLAAKTDLEKANQTLNQSNENLKKLEVSIKETNSKLKSPENDPLRDISTEQAQKNLEKAKADNIKAKEAYDSANISLSNKFQQLQTESSLFQSISQIGNSSSTIIESVGKMIDQSFQASSKEHDAMAQKIQTQGEDLTQEMQNQMETINDIKEFFRSMIQSNNQVIQAILQI